MNVHIYLFIHTKDFLCLSDYKIIFKHNKSLKTKKKKYLLNKLLFKPNTNNLYLIYIKNIPNNTLNIFN